MAETRTLLSSYVDLRYRLFRSRDQAGLVYKVLLALGVAGLTGLAAQVRIPLPWSPVPITAQTFVVLLSGVMLGRWWGGASLALYAGLGALGVPWFNGWTGG
ncbi:MAG TPA: biotin transporter BioY, partial [Dehalococcoidia bacterium]|nr:biotin transporter BioY [Dehalococcoidia bacterium]